MKRTLRGVYATLIIAMSFFALASCEENDPNNGGGGVPVELPTFSNMVVRTGDSGTIDFTANGTWTMSTDKTSWLKFAASTGQAGEQKIEYTITEDILGFVDDVATITFAIGDQKTTFTATRTSKARELKVYSRFYDVDNSKFVYTEGQIDLLFSASATTYNTGFAVLANYNWKMSVPEWIEIDADNLSGEAVLDLDVAKESLTYAWATIDYAKVTKEDMTGVATFTDRKATDKALSCPTTAPGSKSYFIQSATPKVTLDNKGKYAQASVGGGSIMMEGYKFDVTSSNDGVTFFYLLKDADGWYGPLVNWSPQFRADWCEMATTTELLGPSVMKTNCQLSATPNISDARFATIVALPSKMAEGLTEENLVNYDGDALLPEYQPYILTELTQEGKVALSYAFVNAQWMTGIKMGDTPADQITELPEEFRTLASNELNYLSVDTYTRMGSQFKIAGWNYKGYESMVSVSFIIDGEVVEQAPTWITVEPNGAGASAYFSVSFKENPAWEKPRSVWVLVKEYEYVGDTEQLVANMMTVKITQGNNNFNDEEPPME